MEEVVCPLCPPESGARPYHEEGGWAAVQCAGCGLVYVTPRPTEAELKRLYEGQDTHVDVAGQMRKRHRKCAEARASLRTLERHGAIGRGVRLLEIGCGAGWFLAEARARGLDATGVDVNRHFVRFASEELGVRAIEGTLDALPPGETFDVIFHRNVLSHLAYPVEAFARMGERLRPGGLMVFETGNVAELPGSTWAGTEALALPDHLFHFGEATIRALLERTGFSCVEVRRCAVLDALPPIWRLRRALACRRPRKNATSGRRPPRVDDEALAAMRAPPARPFVLGLASLGRSFAEAAGRALARPRVRCSLVVVAKRLERVERAPRAERLAEGERPAEGAPTVSTVSAREGR